MPAIARTNDQCHTKFHGGWRAYRSGCVCPEAAVAYERRLASQAASQRARGRRVRTKPPADATEGLDSEPDYVLVDRVCTGEMRWRDVLLDVDRAAIVAEMARTLPPSTIASRLGTTKASVERLLKLADDSLRLVAA